MLVTIATICAFPLAYYAMSQWLQSYYYRISLGVVVFLTAAGLTMMIAIVSVSFQAIKAALGNPVDALKYE